MESDIKRFLIEYIFSNDGGVYYSCNEGSIFEISTERNYNPLIVSRCLLGMENELVEKGLIEKPFLKKTKNGAKSRFYKPKVSVEEVIKILNE